MADNTQAPAFTIAMYTEAVATIGFTGITELIHVQQRVRDQPKTSLHLNSTVKKRVRKFWATNPVRIEASSL
jgi:hypothetical protein